VVPTAQKDEQGDNKHKRKSPIGPNGAEGGQCAGKKGKGKKSMREKKNQGEWNKGPQNERIESRRGKEKGADQRQPSFRKHPQWDPRVTKQMPLRNRDKEDSGPDIDSEMRELRGPTWAGTGGGTTKQRYEQTSKGAKKKIQGPLNEQTKTH